MLKYFSEIRDNNKIYSCDMIRISFCTNRRRADELERFINFECACRTDVEVFPIDTRFRHFKYFVNFTYDKDAVMKCGYGFNGAKAEDNYRGFIEFNPNKLADDVQFQKDYAFLWNRLGDYEVTRMDVAIDLLNVQRDKVFVRKDNRRYKVDAGSPHDKTEYLGARNAPGRVKVYNKSLESKLPQPLTRIEITTEPSLDDFKRHIPQVYNFGVSVQQTLFSSLNKTDTVILALLYRAITDNYDYGMMWFNSLGKDKRKKLKPFLLPEETLIQYDTDCVRQVFDNIRKQFHLNF